MKYKSMSAVPDHSCFSRCPNLIMTFNILSLLSFLATACILGDSLTNALPASPRAGLETTSGRYVGHCSAKRSNAIEFLGIRYAQPPTGELRFEAPVAFSSNEIFEASVQPDDCPYVGQNWGSIPGEPYSHAPRVMAQESADGYNAMNEDCLKMNIWTISGRHAKKPVMVFLYGGGKPARRKPYNTCLDTDKASRLRPRIYQ